MRFVRVRVFQCGFKLVLFLAHEMELRGTVLRVVPGTTQQHPLCFSVSAALLDIVRSQKSHHGP